MPASLPGSTTAENLSNPIAGKVVSFDPLSGPKGSPLDARTISTWSGGAPTYTAAPTNLSTGGLSTGIGFGVNPIRPAAQMPPSFTDDIIPGQTRPGGTSSAFLLYIGGGRSTNTGAPNPYTAAMLGLCFAGGGAARDSGASPARGFPAKVVTAAAGVADGAAIETGYVNRCGRALVTGESCHGVASTALTAPA